MAELNPYIHFNGNAEEAFHFYRSVFGGELINLVRYKDLVGYDVSEEDAERIMFVALPIGKGSKLSGADVLRMMGDVTESDNRNKIYISAESREDADRLFNGLSEGGDVELPMSEGPFESYFGLFTDRFGVQWMISYSALNFLRG